MDEFPVDFGLFEEQWNLLPLTLVTYLPDPVEVHIPSRPSTAGFAAGDYPAYPCQISRDYGAEERFEGHEPDCHSYPSKVVESPEIIGVLDTGAEPQIRGQGQPHRTETSGSLREDLEDMLWVFCSCPDYLVDSGIRYVMMGDVAHASDEHHPRFLPGGDEVQGFGVEDDLEGFLPRVSMPSGQASRHLFGVAVVTGRAYRRAAVKRIKCLVGPCYSRGHNALPCTGGSHCHRCQEEQTQDQGDGVSGKTSTE